MPYKVTTDTQHCPVSKPHAVMKADGSKVMGCHATEADANRQMAALHANEKMNGMIRSAMGK